MKYRANYHTYSKGWFIALILLIPAGLVIGALISGKYTWQEGLASGGFFAFLMLVLMLNMFRKMDKNWRGRLVAKSTADVYGRSGRRRKRVVGTAYRLEIRTEAGRKERIEVSPGAFKLFQVGDEVAKYRGLPFPDRTLHPGETKRMCLACGRPYDIALPACPGCRFESPFQQES
ncbi:MAG: hypothetical protein NTZ26_12140 [Candidatus Aminicenantes bacterium]|nr:hypothetical protein [Candidatus Aminicenantes bacterium]